VNPDTTGDDVAGDGLGGERGETACNRLALDPQIGGVVDAALQIYAKARAEAQALGLGHPNYPGPGYPFFARVAHVLLVAEGRIATSPNPQAERLEAVDKALQMFEVEEVPDVVHHVQAHLLAARKALAGA
jgi:hypothetical protein